jgi:ketosteroid isomerase-like protein
MSQENVESTKRGVAALNKRELPDELGEELLAPDYRIENVSTAVTDRTYYGITGVREWLADFFEALDEAATYETEEILADGDDFVVARVRIVGHGAHSGAPVELRWVSVNWFRDGKMTRTVGYARRREAFQAVGLAE